MSDREEEKASNIAWLALLVAIVALLFSVVSFNRTGRGIDAAQEEGADLGEGQIRAVGLVAHESRLAAIRTRLASGRGYRQAASELESIRNDVRELYEDASSERSRQQWLELDRHLEKTEAMVRGQQDESVGALEQALEMIRKNIQAEEADDTIEE